MFWKKLKNLMFKRKVLKMSDLMKPPTIEELQVFLFREIEAFAEIDREYAALSMRRNAIRIRRDKLQDEISFQLLLLDVRKVTEKNP